MNESPHVDNGPLGLHHAAVNVVDWDASITFYRDVLGFELIGGGTAHGAEIERATRTPNVRLRYAMFRVGEQHFELIEYLEPTPGRMIGAHHDGGQAHIAFKVRDVEATYTELAARGVQFLSRPVRFEEPVPVGGAFVYTIDPNGVMLEFIEDVNYSPAPKHTQPTRDHHV
jgi:lactoylglutathione lyase